MQFTPAARKRVWYLALIVVPFVFVALLNRWFASVADFDSPWLVQQARVLPSSMTAVENLPQGDWQTVVLPDFQLSRRTVPASVWYRMEVASDEPPSQPWAIFIVGPSARYAVFVNDRFVGASEHVALPMPQHVKALIFRFPGGLLRPGSNQIHLHSVGERPRSVLQSVQVGPDAALTRSYETARFALSTLKLITVTGLIAMAVVMLVLSATRSGEAIFGWYAIALLFMAAHIGIRLFDSAPFGDTQLWKNFVDVALIGYIVCAAFFINRYLNLAHDRYEKWLLYWGIFGAAILVLDPLWFDSSMPGFFNRLWLPATLPICIYETWLLIRATNSAPNIENRLLALLCCVGLAVGTCDGLIGIESLSSTVYLPYTMGPVLCVFWFFLIRRFVRAVNAAEAVRRELELRVREQTRELGESLVRVKDMEREQALSAERERIMRDMHDGVGAQLVQALSIASSRPELKSMEEPLRGCLEELRLIIDSIEPIEGNLASVLGTLRMRMTRRLNDAAIQLRWRVDDIPLLADFGPSRVLQVSRIVHEAIANALKHSGARQIMLSAHLVEGDPQSSVVIEVVDDGPGLRPGQVTSGNCGRGLDNMRRRAEELNAHLTVDFGAHGTSVRLVLPVEALASRDLQTTQAPNLA